MLTVWEYRLRKNDGSTIIVPLLINANAPKYSPVLLFEPYLITVDWIVGDNMLDKIWKSTKITTAVSLGIAITAINDKRMKTNDVRITKVSV